jgi:hypothetical protein
VTDRASDGDRSVALIAAALALPGILPSTATAQAAPDERVVALRYYDYRDWQSGGSRMTVRSPTLYALLPLSEGSTLEGSVTHDTMSGASPLFHNTLSGASGLGVTDYRTAGDFKYTKYLDGNALALGAAYSDERDYVSRAGLFEWRHWSDDRNRTYVVGVGATHDRIDSSNGIALHKRRETFDLLLGVTQVLNAQSIVESSITYSQGRGYYSDPYKLLDTRPDHRRVFAWLTRYNHHWPEIDATVRVSYRYLHDSFGDESHAIEASWVQSLPHGLVVTPTLRYYTQSAADFYFDPPFPQGAIEGRPYTADTRLSAFGAITAGLRVAKAIGSELTIDVALNFYRQRSDWRIGGGGSPDLLPFSARWIELGIEKRF